MSVWTFSKYGSLVVVTLAAFAVASCATAVPRAQNFDEASETSRLSAGRSILLQGQPDVAIRDYFDPIIRDYEDHFSRSGEVVYSAHTTTEAILYAALPGAAAKAGGKVPSSTSKTEVLDGVWADALELKGYALVDLKRDDDAAVALKQATVLAPFFPTPWNELGYVYQSERNWVAAMDAYRQAENGAQLLEDEKENPTRPLFARALRGQGYVLTELGKLADAEAIYRRCLKFNPDDANSKHELEYIAQLKEQNAASTKASATTAQ